MKQSETKRNGGRCSITGLRRLMAMLLAAMATTVGALAQIPDCTVTLKPGEGTGTDIVLNTTNDYYGVSEKGLEVPNGKFFTMTSDGNSLWFRAPDCPDSFTAPEGKVFSSWDSYSQGGYIKVNSDLTLTARWKINGTCSMTMTDALSFSVDDFDLDGYAPVTFTIFQLDFGPYANQSSQALLQFGETEFVKDEGATCIPFEVYSADHDINSGGSGYYYPIYSTGTYEMAIRIDPEVLAAAAPGIYTCDWRYYINWNDCGDYDFGNTPSDGEIALTLEVPAKGVTLTDDNDNAMVLSDNGGKICTVTLNGRTLYTDGDWNTLCLPFSLSSLGGTPLEGFTVMELDGQTSNLTDGTLTLNFTNATGIVAGKPYIVKKDATVIQASDLDCTAISGTPGYTDGQGFGSLVDGYKETKWCSSTWHSGGLPCECMFKMASPVSVTGYTLTTGNDTGDEENWQCNPRVWTLEARLSENDDWTTIDSRDVWDNEDDELPGESFATEYFTVAQQGTYQYFRFCVQETGCALMQLAELTLKGTYTETVIENPKFKNVTINASEPQAVSSQDGKVSFKGSYAPVSRASEDKSILYLGAGNTLYYPSEAMTIGACRAYFQLAADEPASAVRAFKLNFGDDGTTANPSAIHAIETAKDESAPHAWYSLDGRRLATQPATPGVYIYGGKKMVVK